MDNNESWGETEVKHMELKQQTQATYNSPYRETQLGQVVVPDSPCNDYQTNTNSCLNQPNNKIDTHRTSIKSNSEILDINLSIKNNSNNQFKILKSKKPVQSPK